MIFSSSRSLSLFHTHRRKSNPDRNSFLVIHTDPSQSQGNFRLLILLESVIFYIAQKMIFLKPKILLYTEKTIIK